MARQISPYFHWLSLLLELQVLCCNAAPSNGGTEPDTDAGARLPTECPVEFSDPAKVVQRFEGEYQSPFNYSGEAYDECPSAIDTTLHAEVSSVLSTEELAARLCGITWIPVHLHLWTEDKIIDSQLEARLDDGGGLVIEAEPPEQLGLDSGDWLQLNTDTRDVRLTSEASEGSKTVPSCCEQPSSDDPLHNWTEPLQVHIVPRFESEGKAVDLELALGEYSLPNACFEQGSMDAMFELRWQVVGSSAWLEVPVTGHRDQSAGSWCPPVEFGGSAEILPGSQLGSRLGLDGAVERVGLYGTYLPCADPPALERVSLSLDVQDPLGQIEVEFGTPSPGDGEAVSQ